MPVSRSAPSCGLLLLLALSLAAQDDEAEVLVYGGTSAGVIAARHLAESGRTVLLVAPSGVLGGLSASGLGATDTGHPAAITGRAREFYREVGAHYADPTHWRPGARERFPAAPAADGALFRFEPKVARALFERRARHERIRVLRGIPLAARRAVAKRGAKLEVLRLADGRRLHARLFIDASYEGDLASAAGAGFRIGRESNALHGESLNGVQTTRAVHHQFTHATDPYLLPGDPESGLVPHVSDEPPGPEGSGDAALQAFCFRLCLTTDDTNRVPFPVPEDYREEEYELLLRHFEAGSRRVPWHGVRMPNDKTDTNNNGAFSTDMIGANHGWPLASHAERQRILARHRRYQEGLLHTLARHPRVPEAVREEVARFGLSRDEFFENGHWPPLLYVREGRRLVGRTVMTEHHCLGLEEVDRPIALASYTMDSHNVRRYVDLRGRARNEGDVQVRVPRPFGIAYGAIRPRAGRADNLLVPVALSATHIAFGSIRMEPVFMALGQAAATACDLALDRGGRLDDVAYPDLADALRADGMRLRWETASGARRVPVDPRPDVPTVIDDADARYEGGFATSTSQRPFHGAGYRHDGAVGGGRARAHFEFRSPSALRARLELAWTAHPNRAPAVILRIVSAGRTLHETVLDQRLSPEPGPLFHDLGTFDLAPGPGRVTLVTPESGGHVVVDALRIRPLSR